MKLLYYILAPIQIFAWIIFTIGVNWWSPAFANKDGWLPNWLKWAQTFDASLDTGRQLGFFKTKSVFWGRVFWLYRNTAAGFGYWVLGVPFYPKDWEVKEFTETSEGFRFHAESKDGHWNTRYSGKYFAYETGWKAWNMTDDNMEWKTTPWGPEWRVPITVSITINLKAIFKGGYNG